MVFDIDNDVLNSAIDTGQRGFVEAVLKEAREALERGSSITVSQHYINQLPEALKTIRTLEELEEYRNHVLCQFKDE